MQFLSLTLDDLAANVALDQALLEAAEEGQIAAPLLRLWEPNDYGIVLGKGSRAESEVCLSAFQRSRIPVVRRCSGGGAVVTGKGCLMYAVVLPIETRSRAPSGRPRTLDQASSQTSPLPADGMRPSPDIHCVHAHVLEQIASAVLACGVCVERAGTSDLALVGDEKALPQKVSGNSLRLKRRWLLYHGTLLYAFDLMQAEQLLGRPPRPPAYRQNRGHQDFLANLPIERSVLVAALQSAWNATKPLKDWPRERLAKILKP